MKKEKPHTKSQDRIRNLVSFFKSGDRLKDQFMIAELSFWTLVLSLIFLVNAGFISVSDKLIFYYASVILVPLALILCHVLIHFMPLQKALFLESVFIMCFSFLIVHLTGGIYSPLWFLYFFPIMISLLVFEGRACQFILLSEGILILYPVLFAGRNEVFPQFSLAFLKIFGLTVVAELGFFLSKRSAQERSEIKRLNNELSQKVRHLTSMINIARIFLQRKDIRKMVKACLEQIVKAIGFEKGMVIYFPSSHDDFKKPAYVSYGTIEQSIREFLKYYYKKVSEAAKINQQAEAFSVTSMMGEVFESELFQELEKSSIKMIHTAPIISGEHISGFIILFSQTDKSLNDEELYVLDSMSNLMSLGFLDYFAIRSRDEAIKTKVETISELKMLYDLTGRIVSSKDFSEVIATVNDSALNALNVECSLLLLKEKNESLKVAGFRGINESLLTGVDFYSESEVVRSIVHDKMTMSSEEFLINKKKDKLAKILKEHNIESFIGIPLQVEETCEGCLIIFCEEKRVFSPKDRMLLLALGYYAAIAIEKNRNYLTLEKQKKDLEVSQGKMVAINHELMVQQGHLMEITEALEKANIDLRKLDEIKTEFVSMVSHELRTPLTAIKEGVALILGKSMGSINEDQGRILTIAKNNVNRLTNLINDILDLSILETGNMDIDLEEINIKDVLENLFETYRHSFEKKKIEFTLDVSKELPRIFADQDRLIQIITNLISNALKYTEKGSVRMLAEKREKDEIVSEIELFPKENWIINEFQLQEMLSNAYKFVRIVISDTGAGIPKKAIVSIFDKFSRIKHDNIDKKPSGTGLGLAIVKRLVLAHNGALFITSEVNKGTEVSVYLPASQDQ